MKNSIKKLEGLMEIGGVRKDILSYPEPRCLSAFSASFRCRLTRHGSLFSCAASRLFLRRLSDW